MTANQEASPLNNQLRMSLSGGMPSKAWMRSLYHLAETEKPLVAIDSSALVGKKYFDGHRTDFTNAFKRWELPDPIWLQDSPDSLLDSCRTRSLLRACDILMVLGGSTERLYQRWHDAGVADKITSAVQSGDIVACGLSAGAMIWYDKGYSDSMQYEPGKENDWHYKEVTGIGILKGIASAHYSDTDVHGLRSDGFKSFLAKNTGNWSRATGIDTYASLVVRDGAASVYDVNPIDGHESANIHVFTDSLSSEKIYQPGDTLQ